LGGDVGSFLLVDRHGNLGTQRFLRTVETSTIFLNVLFYAALLLLLGVSGGILYLTSVEWRNRRLQSNDKKSGKK
jgi:hypothetical protein